MRRVITVPLAVLALAVALVCAACTSGSAVAGSSAGSAAAVPSAQQPAPSPGSPATSARGTGSPGTGSPGASSPGTAGTSPGPPSGPSVRSRPAPAGLTPWPTYHGNMQRTGVSDALPAGIRTMTATTVALDGAVYASPIVAGGTLVVATENDSVYGFGATEKPLWHTSIGSPTPRSDLPCGDIDPLGITGTPFYDAAADTVFLVASLGAGADHELVALDPADGAIRWRQSVDLPGVDQRAMQQRGALTVAAGRVWVPFGGLAGDCGDYRGRVVGVPVGGGTPEAFTVPTGREGGIWAPPGPTVIGDDLLVSVGNGESTQGSYDHSDSVLRLHGTQIVDSFSPTTWASDNASDLDLGSQGPALVQGKWVFIAGKSGIAYVLAADHLGGIGGQVSQTQLCTSFGGTAVDGDVVYVPCTDGVRAVRIDPDGQLTVLWHADSSITGSPVVGAGLVFALDTSAGVLHALDPATGASVASVDVGAANRFATPAISGGRLYTGTLSGLTIVTAS